VSAPVGKPYRLINPKRGSTRPLQMVVRNHAHCVLHIIISCKAVACHQQHAALLHHGLQLVHQYGAAAQLHSHLWRHCRHEMFNTTLQNLHDHISWMVPSNPRKMYGSNQASTKRENRGDYQRPLCTICNISGN
jgi:hypothetical protein